MYGLKDGTGTAREDATAGSFHKEAIRGARAKIGLLLRNLACAQEMPHQAQFVSWNAVLR